MADPTLETRKKPIRVSGPDMRWLRKACYEREGQKCYDCGMWLRWDAGYWNSMEMSHQVPRSLGGEDTLENVRARCRPCHINRDGHGQPMYR